MSTKDVSSKENSDIPTLGKTPPMLSYFCVYNPSLSQSEENTKDQILYYTAKKVVPADVKMKQVGLAQALVSVASTFSTTEVTQNVHSQKNRMVFLQPEPGFWMHMCIELGILRRQIKDQKGKEKLVTEYLDTELNDQALSAVLEIGYEQFKLLNGTMSSLLYGEDSLHQTPNRHRTRTLMLAIEEFFSTWIWLWDFDKLDTMVFGAVFNGVPSQPVLRSNYLNIYDLDNAIQKHFDQHINHLLVLDDDGSLIYRSPSLDLIDVRALRKYIIKRVESHIINAEEMEKKQKEKDIIAKKEKGSTTLKSLTKSFSQVHILNYFTNKSFTSAPATPVSASLNEALDNVANNDVPINDDAPSTDISEPPPADGQEINHRGKFLTGMIEVNIEDLNGEERIVTRPDIVHVYINSQPNIENHEDSDDNESENGYFGLTEYILIIYKDNNDLTWSFLLPSFIQEVDDLVKDIDFYTSLEKFMMEQNLDDITESVLENIKDIQERSLTLGKHYKCFFYDNATLNMKSTMVDQQGRVMARAVPTTNSAQRQGQFVGGLPMSNEILLQLLNVKYDFETIPHTEEVYTRSTVNHWIVGKRVYNSSTPFPSSIKNIIRPIINKNKTDKQQHESDMDSHEAPPDDSPIEENIPFNPSDYSEIYLVAAKKDVSLADIEENIHKVTKTLTEVLHID